MLIGLCSLVRLTGNMSALKSEARLPEHGTSPITSQQISSTYLIANMAVRSFIQGCFVRSM